MIRSMLYHHLVFQIEKNLCGFVSTAACRAGELAVAVCSRRSDRLGNGRMATPADDRVSSIFAFLVRLAWSDARIFSIAGFYHRYYLSMLAPAIAVLVGAGGAMLALLACSGRRTMWLFPAALVATYAFEVWTACQYRASFSPVWPLAVGFYGLGMVCLWFAMEGREHGRRIVYRAALIGVLALPAYWSLTPVLYGTNSTIPYAGPDLQRDRGAPMPTAGMPDGQEERLLRGETGQPGDGARRWQTSHLLTALVSYLEQHVGEAKYLAATIRATEAAELMLHTDRAVMAMGGFGGTDPVLTPKKLEEMARNGEVKYFLLSGEGRGNHELVQWIQTHCKEVPFSEWNGGQKALDGGAERREMTLYVYNG